MAGWLTVPKVAAKYRVSERTVYRWYRSGRLKPVKIGREWLLPDTESDLPSPPPGPLWKGHVLALVDTLEQAAALEEHLLEVGRQNGCRLCRGQWRGNVKPPDVDLGTMFKTHGASAVLEFWQHEIAAAAREGRPLLGLSDPPPKDFGPFEALLQYERDANGVGLVDGCVVCLYRCEQLTGPQLSSLMYVHEGVLLPSDDAWLAFRKQLPV